MNSCSSILPSPSIERKENVSLQKKKKKQKEEFSAY